MSYTNGTGNDNRQLDSSPSFSVVDSLANELCTEYGNAKFYKWYCKVINTLGIERVLILRGMCVDAKYPGQLFSRRANQEMQAKLSKQKLYDLRKNYGKTSN